MLTNVMLLFFQLMDAFLLSTFLFLHNFFNVHQERSTISRGLHGIGIAHEGGDINFREILIHDSFIEVVLNFHISYYFEINNF